MRATPSDPGGPDARLAAFISGLATRGNVSASTQNQALSALLFLHKDVLGREIKWLNELVRAKPSVRLPVVLPRDEVTAVLSRLHGTPWLMASLLYGSGLRLLEWCRLRVKDVAGRRRDRGKREIGHPEYAARLAAFIQLSRPG